METLSNNLWKEVDSFYTCPLTGVCVATVHYIKNWDKLYYNRKIEKVEPKQFYFNTGPTAYSKAESYIIYNNRAEVVGIYIIRYRNDGFGEQIFKWDGTYEEWENYSTLEEYKRFMKTMDRFNDM